MTKRPTSVRGEWVRSSVLKFRRRFLYVAVIAVSQLFDYLSLVNLSGEKPKTDTFAVGFCTVNLMQSYYQCVETFTPGVG